MKRNELLQKIHALNGIQGTYLKPPVNNKLHAQLTQMLNQGRDKCLEIANNYMTQAQKQGLKFNDNFKENHEVQEYMRQLKFLSDNNLIEGIKKRYIQFKTQMETHCQMIEQEII